MRVRALVLAAGLGMRLRPLTGNMPKPLLPVLGEPILGHTLRRLAAAGCEAAAINLHHRGDQIRRALGNVLEGMPLTWSEEPQLLGTLGALQPLAGFFAGADLGLIVNGDSLCRWPLTALLRRHQASGAPATLLLTSRADPGEFGGGVAIDRGGALLSLRPGATSPEPARGTRRLVFAGAHVLSRELLARIAADPGPVPADVVRDLYEPLLAEQPGSLATLTTGRRWHDLGTPRRYLAATLDWARAADGGRWVSLAAEVSPQAAVRRASVEAGCRVAAGASVEDSVLLPGATVGAGCEVRGSILGPGAELAAGNHVSAQLVVAGGQSSDLR
ncbi:MAG TPA: NDP-sugar synthase [Thermoanaerobaculia bacterium]|nr:NDP-sugar synthase [Thermoanaerobaculia bacterium]